MIRIEPSVDNAHISVFVTGMDDKHVRLLVHTPETGEIFGMPDLVGGHVVLRQFFDVRGIAHDEAQSVVRYILPLDTDRDIPQDESIRLKDSPDDLKLAFAKLGLPEPRFDTPMSHIIANPFMKFLQGAGRAAAMFRPSPRV